MAGLDPTIPLQTGQQNQQQNPMAALGGTIQTLNGLQQLRQNQMQLQANQVFSDAYRQAVQPDGTVDFNKLQSLAAQGGAGAYLPQFMGQVAQQRNQQQQYDTSKLDMAIKQQQQIRANIGSLALDPDIGNVDMTDKIASQITQAVQNGILPIGQGVREIKSIPTDPASQKAWINNHLMSSLSGEQQLQALKPTLTQVQQGGGTSLVATNPITAQPRVVGTFQNSLSPEQLAAPKEVVDTATGRKQQITTQEWLQDRARANAGQQPLYSDLSSADTAANEAAGKQYSADLANASGYANRLYTLNQALSGLQGATTGQGSEGLQNLKSILTTFNVPLPSGGVDSVKNFDEANKYLTQYATAQASGLGENTDSKLATVLSGNASTHINNLAAQDVVRATIGMEQMKNAQLKAFQESGLAPAQYQKFATQFNQKINPGVFVWNNMTNAAKHKFFDSLTGDQQEQFYRQHQIAVQNGWVGAPEQSAQVPAATGG